VNPIANTPVAQAVQFLQWLHDGDVFETCAIKPKKATSSLWEGRAGLKSVVAGWFVDADRAAKLACQIDAVGIYVTLNPVQDALLSRAESRLVAGIDRTEDNSIAQIKNLLIDVDPIRPKGVSSSNEEHQAALEMAKVIRYDLQAEGWPEPIYADSGNGAHLIYAVDFPNDSDSKELIKSVLNALALKYGEKLRQANLDIDQKVFNPARLTKLYGTWTRKGDNTQARPHRLSKAIEIPDRQKVSSELLHKLISILPVEEIPQTRQKQQYDGGRLDVESYLQFYGQEIVKIKEMPDGHLYCLQHCVFDSSHSGNESGIGQQASGLLYYHCFHNTCNGRKWADAKRVISGEDSLARFTIGGSPRALNISPPKGGDDLVHTDINNSFSIRGVSSKLQDLLKKSDLSLYEQNYILEKIQQKPAKKTLTEEIDEWILTTSGTFLTTDIYREMNLSSVSDKKHASKCIQRLVQRGKIVPHGDKRGSYRIVKGLEEMDWQSANIEDYYPIKWPFELEKLVTIYPGNIIVVAGEKGAGKSTFMYNLIHLNQGKHKIAYFNSESGPQELKKRLSNFQGLGVGLKDWKFKAYARSGSFPEVIFPDHLNIIDYYEFGDEAKFHDIAGELRKIHDRLRRGICVVALQKKIGAELGRGGDFSTEKARLYLTMHRNGELRIFDAKMWTSDKNPKGTVIKFKLVQGTKFLEYE